MRGLLLANINHAGDAPKLLRQRGRDLVICRQVTANNLNIERRGQSKVDRLGHDVGRHEIKFRAGKFLVQIKAQLPNIISRRLMIWVERDQNIRVRRSSCAGVVVAQINPGVRKADVVDNALELPRRDSLSDGSFYLIDKLGRLFNARSGRRAHVQVK